MTLVQLDYALAVANCGSFSAAAEDRFVTQPTLSMQIKLLEDELGILLFDRSKKPVIMTQAGLEVIEQIRNIMAEVDKIEDVVANLKGVVSGKIRMGVIPTIAPYLIHKFVPDFVAHYPNAQLEIHEMQTKYIIEAINHDQIDVALVAGGTCGEGVQEYELFDDHFYGYVSPQNTLFNRSNIRMEDIVMEDLILLSVGNCMRDQVLELCQAHSHTSAKYSFEAGSIDTLMRIVDCTPTMTIIPEMALEFIPKEHKNQVKTLLKGATSRKIALVVRRTFAKHSLVNALKYSILEAKK